MMKRREVVKLLTASTAVAAARATLTAFPALAQSREISMLGWNHYVPRSDVKLSELLVKFRKETGSSVRSDHVPSLQLPAEQDAERQAQNGHDLIMFQASQPWQHADYLVDLDDVVSELNKQYGNDVYPFMRDAFVIDGHWKVLPFSWQGYPGNYLESKFKQIQEQPADTWRDVIKAGRKLKNIGHPVGISIGHCNDANATFWSICWSFGGKVLEADGKTISLASSHISEVLDYYKELFSIMEPEVLSWDDLSNNRCINSGHCAWIHNPVSSYIAARADGLPIAKDLNHHPTPSGPAGRFFAAATWSYGIWKFSKNIAAAKDLLRFLFREDNLREWVQAGEGFNVPMWRYWESNPVWANDPKLKMLPREGVYARMRGWPAPPSTTTSRIDNSYILPDMVRMAIGGVSNEVAISWASNKIAQIIRV